VPGGKSSRNKGRAGQRAAQRLFAERDWIVHELNAGTAVADFLVADPDARVWLAEIKNTQVISLAHRRQAIQQAAKKRLPWLLLSHLSGTRFWLLQRQGLDPVLWSEKDVDQA
jgi:hypothetical protein